MTTLLPMALAVAMGAPGDDRSPTVGRSAQGRPIELQRFGAPTGPVDVLVFGCIHGTECAARDLSLARPCPGPASIAYVPNLNPDGFTHGSRLNGRGVDLNRNFPSGWQPYESRWDPEYSGPRPFSEPETRIAAHLIRALRPRVTVWFHQQAKPLVRAWGQSVPAARRFAHRSGLPFVHLPWIAGTAPNWQNHTFPGTASFVVELPPGPLAAAGERRLEGAILDLARPVSRNRVNGKRASGRTG